MKKNIENWVSLFSSDKSNAWELFADKIRDETKKTDVHGLCQITFKIWIWSICITMARYSETFLISLVLWRIEMLTKNILLWVRFMMNSISIKLSETCNGWGTFFFYTVSFEKKISQALSWIVEQALFYVYSQEQWNAY